MTSQGIPHENSCPEQVFDFPGMYLLTFCFFAMVALAKLLHIGKDAARLAEPPSSVQRFIVALGNLYMAAYLPILLRRISNRVEQVAIVLLEVSCVLWLASFLSRFGVAWANVPYGNSLQTIIASVIAILAGVRTFQMARNSRRPVSDETNL